MANQVRHLAWICSTRNSALEWLTLLTGHVIGILKVWLYDEHPTADSLEHRALYRLVHTSMRA